MSIQAVVFDADGVVVPPWRFARFLEQQHAITPKVTRDFFCGVFEECLLGKRDLKEALAPFLPQWHWKGSVDDFVATWLQVENAIDEQVVSTIRALREAGFTCCLATCQERYRAEYMANTMGFSELFDRLFFSCQLGFQKPEPAYYHSVTHALGMSGQNILFWDDCPANVASARACGWQAELYTDFEKLAIYLDSNHLLKRTFRQSLSQSDYEPGPPLADGKQL